MKQKLYKVYGLLHSLKYPTVLFATIKSIFNEQVYDNKKHITLATDWLLYMQNRDGGYSRKFSFIKGRDESYIETTGYIIPTLLQLQDKKYINSALKAGEWLLKIQNRDGSFSEIDNNQPFVFDTGQVLLGLNALFEFTNDERYKSAIEKASNWLIEVQEDDGSWERYAYNGQKHSYYSRVASALYKSGMLLKSERFKESALKNIEWVLANQQENGYFKYSSFSKDTDAYLHTLIYILEGLLDIYEYTKDEKIIDAVLKSAAKFEEINLTQDLILCSQYDEKFQCVNSERCMTGVAQWLGVVSRLYGITEDEAYKKCAINTAFYLKAKQIKSSSMRGGFSASMPFWGRYGSFDFVNWTNKFFIDAMMEYEKFCVTTIEEQESYVGSAFGMTNSVVTDSLSYMDRAYIKAFKKRFDKNKSLKVLDIGCGKGVIIKELQKSYPNYEFIGVDPIFESENIHKGSIYNIPFEDKHFDIVMSFEVLQHTYLKEALSEMYRVLKVDGKVVIGERNRLSILGFIKPLYELMGRWMYPFDSAFRERWYSVGQWKYQMKIFGFDIKDIESMDNKDDRVFKTNRYFFIIGEKV